jgi:hypothetical protein
MTSVGERIDPMPQPPPASQLNLFSGLLLVGLTVWMLVLTPGQVTPGKPFQSLLLLGSLAGTYVLYLGECNTHGILYSFVSCIVFILSDRHIGDHWDEGVWQLTQITFLAIVGLNMIVWSVFDRAAETPIFWLLGAAGLISLASLLWIEAEQTHRWLATYADPVSAALTVSHQRIRLFSLVVMVGGGLFGLLFAPTRPAAAWFWFAASALAPVAGFGLARLWAPVEFAHMTRGAHWERLGADLAAWISQPDLLHNCRCWCWTTPAVVLALVAVGAWRTVGRGFRQRKQGQRPLAWLMFLAAILLLTALLPVASGDLRPLGLLWLGIALSVFAVADLLLLLFEQLALPAPLPGPSGVPHV